jgi:membrane protein involved in colicin uptake
VELWGSSGGGLWGALEVLVEDVRAWQAAQGVQKREEKRREEKRREEKRRRRREEEKRRREEEKRTREEEKKRRRDHPASPLHTNYIYKLPIAPPCG